VPAAIPDAAPAGSATPAAPTETASGPAPTVPAGAEVRVPVEAAEPARAPGGGEEMVPWDTSESPPAGDAVWTDAEIERFLIDPKQRNSRGGFVGGLDAGGIQDAIALRTTQEMYMVRIGEAGIGFYAISAICSPTSAGLCGPAGSNHHATQLHMPMTDSAASRSSRGRNSPLDAPSR